MNSVKITIVLILIIFIFGCNSELIKREQAKNIFQEYITTNNRFKYPVGADLDLNIAFYKQYVGESAYFHVKYPVTAPNGTIYDIVYHFVLSSSGYHYLGYFPIKTNEYEQTIELYQRNIDMNKMINSLNTNGYIFKIKIATNNE